MDPSRIQLRHQVRLAYGKWDPIWSERVMTCAICSRPITPRWPDDAWDAHKYLVKRHSVPKGKQHLIFVVENVVPLHHDCHTQRGQTASARERCLEYAVAHLGAERIAAWYRRVQPEIGLPCVTVHIVRAGGVRRVPQVVVVVGTSQGGSLG